MALLPERVTLSAVKRMKGEGRKVVGVVAWDFQMARIADRAGVDLVSVGDSVGMNLWGRTEPEDMTVEEMIRDREKLTQLTRESSGIEIRRRAPIQGTIIVALQADSGKELWKYDLKNIPGIAPNPFVTTSKKWPTGAFTSRST